MNEKILKASIHYSSYDCYAYASLFYDTPWKCITDNKFCPCKIGKTLELRSIESMLK